MLTRQCEHLNDGRIRSAAERKKEATKRWVSEPRFALTARDVLDRVQDGVGFFLFVPPRSGVFLVEVEPGIIVALAEFFVCVFGNFPTGAEAGEMTMVWVPTPD